MTAGSGLTSLLRTQEPVSALDHQPSPTPLVEPAPDNNDPHALILTVSPRILTAFGDLKYEADYSLDVEHPPTCSGAVEDCPLADYLDISNDYADLLVPFPEPRDLSEDDIAVLNGTVLFVSATRSYTHHWGPEGEDWGVEIDFTWHDEPGTGGPRVWRLFAGLVRPPREAAFYSDFYPEAGLVALCGHDPIAVTLTEDPAGAYLGWLDAPDRPGGGSPDEVALVQIADLFDMQFPYGVKAEVERGKGTVVRLRVEPTDQEA